MRLATFNILHGRNPADDRVDVDRFASAVKSLDADVLALQEVDREQPRSHHTDLTAVAAEAMGAVAHRFVAAIAGTPGATWMAAKSIVTAYAKSGSSDPAEVAAFLRGPRLRLDGSKGVQMNFRPWDGQLRMPITLATADAVIEAAPLDGFEHQVTTLDTLGTDQPEHVCR